jgi:hypothetical protein
VRVRGEAAVKVFASCQARSQSGLCSRRTAVWRTRCHGVMTLSVGKSLNHDRQEKWMLTEDAAD